MDTHILETGGSKSPGSPVFSAERPEDFGNASSVPESPLIQSLPEGLVARS